MPLLFTRNNEAGQDWNNRAIHRHRNGHFIQRNAVEQNFHIFNAVNRNTSFADVANHTFMITVVPTVSGQIKGN